MSLPKTIYTFNETCNGTGAVGNPQICNGTTTQIATVEVTTSTASSTIEVSGIEDMTLLLAFGPDIIAALISALFVAKIWK